jgi:hypothetical protein
MAIEINGARVEFAGYQFGVDVDGTVEECLNYEVAKRLSDNNDKVGLKMRAIYRTIWTDSK